MHKRCRKGPRLCVICRREVDTISQMVIHFPYAQQHWKDVEQLTGLKMFELGLLWRVSRECFLRNGHLGDFGFVAYALIPTEKRNKLDPKCRKMMFFGYIDQ